MILEHGPKTYDECQDGWKKLSDTLRKSDISHNFLLAATSVLQSTLPDVDSRKEFLDSLASRYFSAVEHSRYFSRLRGQIDIDGKAEVFATNTAFLFIQFGIPCNYGLVGYVVEKWDELKNDGKIQPTEDMENAVKVAYELALKVSNVMSPV